MKTIRKFKSDIENLFLKCTKIYRDPIYQGLQIRQKLKNA